MRRDGPIPMCCGWVIAKLCCDIRWLSAMTTDPLCSQSVWAWRDDCVTWWLMSGDTLHDSIRPSAAWSCRIANRGAANNCTSRSEWSEPDRRWMTFCKVLEDLLYVVTRHIDPPICHRRSDRRCAMSWTSTREYRRYYLSFLPWDVEGVPVASNHKITPRRLVIPCVEKRHWIGLMYHAENRP
jgi:hypothetical protein